ncbi:MAG TPA: alpha/beta hydrolase [Terriglobales bacterium]|nr:alpha/beta hydrolase [Terriglobales bacterium]
MATSVSGEHEYSRTLLRNLRYVLFAEFGFFVIIATIGAAYESASARRDRETYHPPGKLIDIGGYRLHLNCSGQGSPTVVLDFGLDGSYLDWYRVQPEVARFTRVCSYDRAGYGWSDTTSKPRLPSILAEELHTLLAAAGEKPPYILVGHSMGSFNALMFAHHYRAEVMGLVLVDGAHPDELLPFYFDKRLWLRLMQFTMPFGLPRWRGWCGSGPQEIAGMKQAIGCQAHVYATHYAQWATFPGAADEVRPLQNFGNLPLVVISRDPDRSKDDDDVWGKREQHWSGLQKRLLELSTNSTQIIATGSGHSIPMQRPDVIVDAVKKLISPRGASN